jgi:hypothetical protein
MHATFSCTLQPEEFTMRKTLLFGIVVVTLATAPASAQSLTDFFRNANLDPLAKSSTIRILVAQSTSKTAQPDVNAFDDFFLINGPGKLVVNFDRNLNNKGEVPLRGWLGQNPYSNHDISADLQDGFAKVIAYFKLANGMAANVAAYKTSNTVQIVYDYSVPLTPAANLCQEYLYTPVTGGFQKGMQTGCFWSLKNFHPHTSAGRLGNK